MLSYLLSLDTLNNHDDFLCETKIFNICAVTELSLKLNHSQGSWSCNRFDTCNFVLLIQNINACPIVPCLLKVYVLGEDYLMLS